MRRLSNRKTAIRYASGIFTLCALLALAALVARNPHQALHESQAQTASIAEAYGRLPLSFEANEGQADASVKFISRGQGYSLFLTAQEAVLALRQDEGVRGNWQGRPSPSSGRAATLRMKLLGASDAPQVQGEQELSGKSNYFIGNDPQKWHTNVANYGRVKYAEIYPGIDLVYYGNQRQLEYDFVLAPGAKTEQIKLAFDGADEIRIDEQGELVFHLNGSEVRQLKPLVYQEVDGERVEIAGNYVLRGKQEVGFTVGHYDAARPLVIDPVLVYSTHVGGINGDTGYGIAVDSQGNAYITGTTSSRDFPVTPGVVRPTVQPLPGSMTYYTEAFVTKLNPAGTALVFSTYLGGTVAAEIGKGIAVDDTGNVYVTGYTGSGATGTMVNDFPTVNAYQNNFGGESDGFVTKLNPNGSAIIYSTYLGGNNSDSGTRVKVNRATGEAYVTGGAGTNFPTTPGAFGSGSSNGGAFIAKFNAAGAAQFVTLIANAYGYDVAIDAAGNSYITGATGGGLPITPGAFQTSSGFQDAFVTKMNPTGTALVYSTYLGGGPQTDKGFGIDIDAQGNAYVTGFTQAPSFPTTPGAFDVSYNFGEDVFVTKLNPTGTALIYSTFIGEGASETGRSIKVDASGNTFITGRTGSPDFPTRNSLQPKNGGSEIFLTKLNPAGSALVYSTFLGEGDGTDVAVDAAGVNAYMTGQAYWIPVTPGSYQTQKNKGNNIQHYDAFAMKVGSTEEPTQTFSIGGMVTDNNPYDPNSPLPPVVTLTGAQNRTTTIGSGNRFLFSGLPTGDYTVTVTKPGYGATPPSVSFPNLGANQSADFTILTNQPAIATLTSPPDGSTYTAPGPVEMTATASDPDGTVTRVEFSAYSSGMGTVFIGSDTTAPYSFIWTNVPAGVWSLTATAVDNLGQHSRSTNLVFINVASQSGPEVTLTSPTNGASFPARTWIPFRATATPSGGTQINYVEFYVGTTKIATDWTWPYGFDHWMAEAGTFSLTARAVDNLGSAGTSSPVMITITPPPPPTISGRVTTNFGGSLNGVKIVLSGAQSAIVYSNANGEYAFPNLVAGASYRVTPEFPGYDLNPIYRDIPALDAGGYTLNFLATQVTPVTAQITRPHYNESFPAPGNIPIEATAQSSAGTITKVDFYAGGDLIGTDTTAPYSTTWNNVPEGYYALHVVATDSTGATGQSGYHSTHVYPAPTTVRIAGELTDGGGFGLENVTVTLSGTVNATQTTSYFGAFSFEVPIGGDYTITPPPQYVFTPTSYTFNNVTEDIYNANFETTQFNTPPTVTMTSPAAGSTYTMPVDITVSANASDMEGSISRVTFQATRVSDGYNAGIGIDSVAPYTINWSVYEPGAYDVYAIARDNVGLMTTSAPVRITVNPPPPGNISGRVVDRNSVGIPGVLMTLGGDAMATTVTDLNGNYAFTNLPSLADYVVTPLRLNYTFSPASRTITRLIGDHNADFTATLVIQPSDFDGDGQTDVAVYRPSTGVWYILRVVDGTMLTRSLGSQSHGDRAVPGNYDGDERTDIALFAAGNWLIQSSADNSLRTERFGIAGDKAVPADYDGDGKTDLAVWRPGNATWYVLNSSDNSMSSIQWGLNDDVPVAGDYDGDGRADMAVFRPTNGYWYIRYTSDGSFAAIHWGTSGDETVAGDYDGDDKTDLAVFRPGNSSWYIRLSSDGSLLTLGWGANGDQPVPGDYDLDGKVDIAIFRPSTGYWYIWRSSNQTIQTQSWGMSGDVPVPFAYLPQ